MALQPINTLKNWFETNDKPLQGQFWDWLDSYWHKDEEIPIDKITGLQSALNDAVAGSGIGTSATVIINQEGTINLAAGELLDVAIISGDVSQPVSISSAAGLGDFLDNEQIYAGQSNLFRLDIYASLPLSLVIECTGTVIFKYYKK